VDDFIDLSLDLLILRLKLGGGDFACPDLGCDVRESVRNFVDWWSEIISGGGVRSLRAVYLRLAGGRRRAMGMTQIRKAWVASELLGRTVKETWQSVLSRRES